jgi:tripartite ATP-independent transporter DctP family solute receptor
MKRIVTAAALAVTGLGLSLSTSIAADFTMKMAVSNAEIETNYSWTHLEVLEREIEARSGGRIDVQIFSGGQLGGPETTVNQTRDGIIEATDASDGHFATTFPDVQVFGAPYLFPSREVAWAVLDGPIGEAMRERMAAEVGLRPLFWTENGGFRHFTSGDKPLRSAADLQGLKMRVQNHPLHLEIAQSLGMSATPIAWLELYTALQTGVVDGQENSISTFLVPKLYEVQKHMILDGHVYAVNTVVVNEAWYQSLPDDLKAVITQASLIARATNRGLAVANEITGRATLEAEGVTVYDPTAAEKEEFRLLVQDKAYAWLRENVTPTLIDEVLAAVEAEKARLGYVAN